MIDLSTTHILKMIFNFQIIPSLVIETTESIVITNNTQIPNIGASMLSEDKDMGWISVVVIMILVVLGLGVAFVFLKIKKKNR